MGNDFLKTATYGKMPENIAGRGPTPAGDAALRREGAEPGELGSEILSDAGMRDAGMRRFALHGRPHRHGGGRRGARVQEAEQHPEALGFCLICKIIVNRAGFPAGADDARLAQGGELLAQRGLTDVQTGFDLADRAPSLQKQGEDLQALRLSEQPEKLGKLPRFV